MRKQPSHRIHGNMSLKSIIGNSKILKNFWHASPLLFSRQINSSALLYARGMRGTFRSLNIKEEEAEDFTLEDIENITDPNFDAMQEQINKLEGDSVRHQRYIQQKTIKQKYFRQYEPKEENLLTWAMKVQLKYLHSTDPDLWTPEALATAFPISALGAQKLLKAKWVPDNEAAIERHDKAVLARWQKYTNGQLGSARLLEEIAKKKLGNNSERLPATVMDQDNMLSTLESLQFENSPQIKNEKFNKKTKFPKAPKIKSGSFVSIIEDYEAQVNTNLAKKGDLQSTEKHQATSQHIDASVITSGMPEYEGEYSKVSTASKYKSSRRNKGSMDRVKINKLMTLDEFIKMKNIS